MLFNMAHGELRSSLGDRPRNEVIHLVDASSGLDWPKPMKVVPISEFRDLFFGEFDSTESQARKERMLEAHLLRPADTPISLLALVLFWDLNRRIHLLVELSGVFPGDCHKYYIAQSAVTIE